MNCPACHVDLGEQREGDCPSCGYVINWKVMLAQAGLPRSVINLHCPSCGYDLRGSTDGDCPECGKAFNKADLERRLDDQSSPMAWGVMSIMGIGTLFTILMGMLPVSLDVLTAAWIGCAALIVCICALAAIRAARLASFRRSVLGGHRRSAGYEASVGLLLFLAAMPFAAAVMGIALVLVSTRYAP